MDELERVTGPTVDVLRLLFSASEPVWGLRVIKETGRNPGTVYPILERLEEAGWVGSRWEDDDSRPGPRRRYYELTADGSVAAQRAIAKFESRVVRTSARAAGAHR